MHRTSLKLAGLGLLASIQMTDVAQAIKTSSTSSVKLESQIESLSAAVQQELAQSGELAGLMSEAELASLVNSEVRAQVASEQKQTQKTNLEAKNHAAKKQAVSRPSKCPFFSSFYQKHAFHAFGYVDFAFIHLVRFDAKSAQGSGRRQSRKTLALDRFAKGTVSDCR